ncbi:MAG: D-glutamate deacylase [Chloroflexi bacterium]|nr:D-glutamate deacylase [Chloroflexota bacterium]MDP6423031.1 amidohydrolase family protein [SAR202 cluster bacterium]MDP6663825.1 amidohydrolase family protein [SAR202 cluster bacterium]MQG56746.1 amidohydrolase family protein [SAR202 cluster bacterium]HAL46667.1 D-glutamate deacylase [Dehalococcoidia bacterium]|tara:strand:+ start:980 stop:2365 length:1386 start_codon:yes stop_codon:yes gene_type:complete
MADSTIYDLVIHGGRVVDPESGLDAVRDVGVSGGQVQVLSESSLEGRETVDATGMVVTAGFIDLHSHGQDAESYETQARDGVTTALELEVGTNDIDRWYQAREGSALINFGASVGHIPVRMEVMNDPGAFLPVADAANREATPEELEQIENGIEHGLRRGALAVGFGLDYTRGCSRWEAIEMFRIAADHGASCHVHLRGKGPKEPMSGIEAAGEVIAAAAITGAALHIVHIQSTGMSATGRTLEMIAGARERGLDVTTECYPYTAGMTAIDSALFNEGWQEQYGIDYSSLQWVETGERLNSTTFAEYREIGGMVIVHSTPQDAVDTAVLSPLTAIATDGLLHNGKGHPRTAGSYSLILGRYVRQQEALPLMDALRKMSLMPAQRLEARAPSFARKGRITPGADADIVVFDPDTVLDRSTYDEPTLAPDGIPHVFVGGAQVVSDGKVVEGVAAGTGVRAPVS